MNSSLPRAALVVLVGLVASCASGGRSAQTESMSKPVVTADDIERNAGQPIENVLQAKFPGVIVARAPDGGVSIRIRGIASFYGNGDPLYVIDDVPIKAGPGGALTGVNPHDIESIRVLSDPADTGIYGMRGANGVILVTTKKPGKSRS